MAIFCTQDNQLLDALDFWYIRQVTPSTFSAEPARLVLTPYDAIVLQQAQSIKILQCSTGIPHLNWRLALRFARYVAKDEASAQLRCISDFELRRKPNFHQKRFPHWHFKKFSRWRRPHRVVWPPCLAMNEKKEEHFTFHFLMLLELHCTWAFLNWIAFQRRCNFSAKSAPKRQWQQWEQTALCY